MMKYYSHQQVAGFVTLYEQEIVSDLVEVTASDSDDDIVMIKCNKTSILKNTR